MKARERQEATQIHKQNAVVENFPPPEDQGKTRDIVAAEIGFGSGKTYEKAKFVAAHAGMKSFIAERFRHQYCMICQRRQVFFLACMGGQSIRNLIDNGRNMVARKKARRRKGGKKACHFQEENWVYIDRHGEWEYRASAKTPAGVTHRFTVTAATKGECRALARERIQKIRQGLRPVHQEVREYFAKWLVDYGYA